jgi:hypothetical protein
MSTRGLAAGALGAADIDEKKMGLSEYPSARDAGKAIL